MQKRAPGIEAGSTLTSRFVADRKPFVTPAWYASSCPVTTVHPEGVRLTSTSESAFMPAALAFAPAAAGTWDRNAGGTRPTTYNPSDFDWSDARTFTEASTLRRLEVDSAWLTGITLGTFAAGIVFGLTLEQCADGLRDIRLTAGRLTQKTISGIGILDDTYNANPDSMTAALVTLARMPAAGRRIAVLGRMGELGAESERGHRRVGEVAGRERIPCIITVGEEARWIAESAEAAGVSSVIRTADTEDAVRALRGLARPGDLVLVKGSRSARLERVVHAMEGGAA